MRQSSPAPCPTGSSTAPGSTTTTAPSARSSSSTGPPRSTPSRARASDLGSCAAPPWCSGPPAIRTSPRSSGPAMPRRSAARPSSSSWRPATGPGSIDPSWLTGSRGSSASLSCSVLRAVLSSVTAPPRDRPPEVAPEPRAPSLGRRERRIDWWRVAPLAGALVLCVVYLIWVPRTVDLAAHEYRAWLFGQEGFAIWNGQWYGGHHTLAYSVISPPLAWLLGAPLTLVIAVLASTALFEPLARAHFGAERARWGAIWFGIGSTGLLFTNRLPFAVGTALGLGALLALQRRRRKLAIFLALLCPMGSPVAGLFLSLAGVAHALGSRRDRRMGIAVAAASFVAAMSLSLTFPEGGYAPFPDSVFIPIMAFVVFALLAIPREERTLRWGVLLYGLGSIVALVFETPMGLNAA